jgi:endonuclease G, mitochondrial
MGRTDNFRADPAIPTGSTALRDYRGSGFDRGHLTPVADMKWSQ